MANTNYLGQNGLLYLITLIKNAFVKKAYKTGSETEYKTLTDNDLTDTLKGNYDSAYTHSTSAHAPSNAQANVIETIKVNGSAISTEGKAVDIPVPLISTDISADNTSDLKSASPKAVANYVSSALADITGIDYKILTNSEYDSEGIPTCDGVKGNIYLVPISDASGKNVYNEFIFINGSFELIGTTAVDLTGYLKTEELVEFSNAEIDNIWASVI